MKRIRLLIIIILIVQMIANVSCAEKPAPSPYDFEYPEEVTPKYCFEHYSAFDPNIVYTDCYKFVTTNDRDKKIVMLGSMEYSAIKGADDLSFMMCYKINHGIGGSISHIYIVRRNDCHIEPIIDYTPLKIELFHYDDLINENGCLDIKFPNIEENPEAYYCYAEHTFSEPIFTISSPEAIAEIMAVAQRPTVMTLQDKYREQETYPSRYELNEVLWQDKPLYVKISFEECAGLVWVGQLFTDANGRVCMERSAYIDHGYREGPLFIDSGDFSGLSCNSWGYPLGNNMDTIIAEIISEE